MGDEGWEIATSYLEMEITFPNFRKEDFHIGIKENVRHQRLVKIFKGLKGLYHVKKIIKIGSNL